MYGFRLLIAADGAVVARASAVAGYCISSSQWSWAASQLPKAPAAASA